MSQTTIWGATDRGPAVGTMRFPVDTGASSTPGYLTVSEMATFAWASPTLVTPALGTPSSGTLTNCTGYTVGNVSGLGTSVATALAINVGSAGSIVVNGGALGTPSSGTLSSCTGLPISTGVSGLGTGIATALAVNTGSAGAPILFNGALGTPSSGALTNCTSIPMGQATGTLAVANGGTGTTTLTQYAVLLGNSGSFIQSSSPGAAGGLFISQGASANPTFNTMSGATTIDSSGVVTLNANYKKHTIGFSNSATPTVAQQGSYVVVPVAGTITAWNIVVDAGTATIKVWKIATGTAAPTSSNSINTSGVSISSNTAIRSTTLSDFTTTAVSANDIFGFEITAVSGVTRIDFQLEITVT